VTTPTPDPAPIFKRLRLTVARLTAENEQLRGWLATAEAARITAEIKVLAIRDLCDRAERDSPGGLLTHTSVLAAIGDTP
jgi:hypothetical protein